MYILILGVFILIAKTFKIGPAENWSWIFVATPFAITWAWWSWSDWSGYTKEKQNAKEREAKKRRIEKIRANIKPYGSEAYSARKKNKAESEVWGDHPERVERLKPRNRGN